MTDKSERKKFTLSACLVASEGWWDAELDPAGEHQTHLCTALGNKTGPTHCIIPPLPKSN